jgi:hypothetical protein
MIPTGYLRFGPALAGALESSTGATRAAHRNVTPTINALRKRCASAAENDGFTKSRLVAPFRATRLRLGDTPFGHSRHALAGRLLLTSL